MKQDAVPTQNPVLRTFKMIREVEGEDEKELKKDSAIAELAGDPRFEAYKRVIESRIRALEVLLEEERDGDTVETLGFKFLATRVAIKHLNEMLHMPEAIGEALKDNG